MSKKKPKKPKTRYLEFAKPRVLARPANATPADLIRVLIGAARGEPIPAGWKVIQPYRNSPTAAWKEEPVERMVKRSARRGGDFVGIYLRRVLRPKAEQYGVPMRRIRRATPAEIKAEERVYERTLEREGPEFEQLAKQQKRSAAARKGWATRRAAAKKKKGKSKRK